MDFSTIIQDLRNKGYAFEDIAKNFTAQVEYLNYTYNNACNALKCDVITFATVGKVAVLAAAAKYPTMSLEKLKEYEKATAAAAEATAKFNIDLGEGKDPVDSFLKALFDDLPTREKKETDKTDEEIIKKFVRALG